MELSAANEGIYDGYYLGNQEPDKDHAASLGLRLISSIRELLSRTSHSSRPQNCARKGKRPNQSNTATSPHHKTRNKDTLPISDVWEHFLKKEFNETQLAIGLSLFHEGLRDKMIEEGSIADDEKVVLHDAACGTGFAILAMQKMLDKGKFDVRFSDGSKEMLDGFRKRSKEYGIKIKPRQIKWEDLGSCKKNKESIHVLQVRGSSLIYAGSWDVDGLRPRENWINDIKSSLKSFFQTIKPGGYFYVDTTRSENLEREVCGEIERNDYPEEVIRNIRIKLSETIRLDGHTRVWDSNVRINKVDHHSTKYSLFLPHKELIELTEECGFELVRKLKAGAEEGVRGEHYDGFLFKKPISTPDIDKQP